MWTAVSELIMERVDDLVYAELLLLSFVLSLFMRTISSGLIREGCGAFIGISMAYYFTGWKLMYSLVTVIVNIAIFRFVKNRHLPLCSFLFTFTYLGLLRAIHFFGLPALVSHSNALQLIMTLRLVGLSFEIEDARRKDTTKHDEQKTRFIAEPSPWQTLFYAYNFCGLFTGPYYTYSMHRDVIDNENVMDLPVWEHIRWRVLNLLWTFPAFILFVCAFPLKMMRQEEFFDENIFYRIWVSFLVFFWMRCRVYSAWMVAESICVLNGIGLYPVESAARAGQGPTKLKEYREKMNAATTMYDSEAVRNLDIWSIEFDPTFRGGMRAWNRSVQFWLANFVYKRVPRAFGVLITLSVSAYWHGIHPGYFLSFLTVPFCTLGEDLIFSVVRKDDTGRRPFIFLAFWYTVRQLGFALMASGFLLLTYKDTIRYWRSVHFHVHVIIGVVIVFVWLRKVLRYSAGHERKRKVEGTSERGDVKDGLLKDSLEKPPVEDVDALSSGKKDD